MPNSQYHRVLKAPLLTKEGWHPDAFYRDDGVVLSTCIREEAREALQSGMIFRVGATVFIPHRIG